MCGAVYRRQRRAQLGSLGDAALGVALAVPEQPDDQVPDVLVERDVAVAGVDAQGADVIPGQSLELHIAQQAGIAVIDRVPVPKYPARKAQVDNQLSYLHNGAIIERTCRECKRLAT